MEITIIVASYGCYSDSEYPSTLLKAPHEEVALPPETDEHAKV